MTATETIEPTTAADAPELDPAALADVPIGRTSIQVVVTRNMFEVDLRATATSGLWTEAAEAEVYRQQDSLIADKLRAAAQAVTKTDAQINDFVVLLESRRRLAGQVRKLATKAARHDQAGKAAARAGQDAMPDLSAAAELRTQAERLSISLGEIEAEIEERRPRMVQAQFDAVSQARDRIIADAQTELAAVVSKAVRDLLGEDPCRIAVLAGLANSGTKIEQYITLDKEPADDPAEGDETE